MVYEGISWAKYVWDMNFKILSMNKTEYSFSNSIMSGNKTIFNVHYTCTKLSIIFESLLTQTRVSTVDKPAVSSKTA